MEKKISLENGERTPNVNAHYKKSDSKTPEEGYHEVILNDSVSRIIVESSKKNGEEDGVEENKDVDGGWAIMVLIASHIISAFTGTVAPCFGLLLGQLTATLNMTNVEIFWVFNIHGVFFSLMLFVCGPLCDRLGHRLVCFTSSVILALSISFLTLVNDKVSLGVLFGLFIGSAVGLCFYTTFLILPRYFSKRRGFALSSNVTGVAFGKIFIPHLIWGLHYVFGFRGGILLYGALIFHCAILAMAFRKPPLNIESPTQDLNCQDTKLKTPLLSGKNKEGFLREVACKMFNSCKALSSLKVTINALSMGSFMMSQNNFMMLVPYWLLSKGYSYSDAAWLISYSAFTNVFARVAMSLLADMKWFRSEVAYMIGAAIAGMACCLFPFQTTSELLTVSIVFWGFGLGMAISLSFNTLIVTVGINNYPTAVSACGLVTSLSYLVAAPMFGLMPPDADAYGKAILVCGVLQLMPTVLFLLLPLASLKCGRGS